MVKARAIELDFSDPDTQLAVAGCVLGVVFGLGTPLWYINRTERDEERLDELRALNRANFQATGDYLSEEEIAKIRKPKWTDKRFVAGGHLHGSTSHACHPPICASCACSHQCSVCPPSVQLQ